MPNFFGKFDDHVTSSYLYTVAMTEFTFFYRTASPFSNFHPCVIDIHGVQFTSSEQLFMYTKARLFHDTEISIKILSVSTPKEAKALGRKVAAFDPIKWDNVKYDLMCIACYHKFKQNDKLKKALLATEDTLLVEASPTDAIWGIGMDVSHPDIDNPHMWKGQNLLGKALSHVRHALTNPMVELASKETLSLFNSWFLLQPKKKIVWKTSKQ